MHVNWEVVNSQILAYHFAPASLVFFGDGRVSVLTPCFQCLESFLGDCSLRFEWARLLLKGESKILGQDVGLAWSNGMGFGKTGGLFGASKVGPRTFGWLLSCRPTGGKRVLILCSAEPHLGDGCCIISGMPRSVSILGMAIAGSSAPRKGGLIEAFLVLAWGSITEPTSIIPGFVCILVLGVGFSVAAATPIPLLEVSASLPLNGLGWFLLSD